ncbi:MAG: cell division/cell wall cluster transcriptional repressor MraZ [Oscillospiraceae bacterium]|nr:cell division/cell wall cluster transcriptional repressor MraZ [Oscillospiraceae bacterium]
MLGRYVVSVDSKNRICVPHKFRGELGTKCVISKDLEDKCLNLYSYERWKEFTEKIERLPATRMKRARQSIYYNSEDVELDAQGRIIINQQLCKDTGLPHWQERELIVVGNSNCVQIWSVPDWNEFIAGLNSQESREKIINDFLEMDI